MGSIWNIHYGINIYRNSLHSTLEIFCMFGCMRTVFFPKRIFILFLLLHLSLSLFYSGKNILKFRLLLHYYRSVFIIVIVPIPFQTIFKIPYIWSMRYTVYFSFEFLKSTKKCMCSKSILPAFQPCIYLYLYRRITK